MEIDRISKPFPCDFKAIYAKHKKPVIITHAIDTWIATQRWSPTYLSENFGDIRLNVETFEKRNEACNSNDYLEKFKLKTISLKEYIEFAESADSNSSNTKHSNTNSLSPDNVHNSYYDEKESYLYLAQQPITEIIPALKTHVEPLGYYSEFIRKVVRLKTLAWIGATECVSSLHYDPLPNFVAQIWGHKQWIIYPPSQHAYLYVPSTLKPSYFSPVDYENPDYDVYPNYRYAEGIEFILEPGEVLYLPEGWVHYVRSLDLSIALNIWWIPLGEVIPIGYALAYHACEQFSVKRKFRPHLEP